MEGGRSLALRVSEEEGAEEFVELLDVLLLVSLLVVLSRGLVLSIAFRLLFVAVVVVELLLVSLLLLYKLDLLQMLQLLMVVVVMVVLGLLGVVGVVVWWRLVLRDVVEVVFVVLLLLLLLLSGVV